MRYFVELDVSELGVGYDVTVPDTAGLHLHGATTSTMPPGRRGGSARELADRLREEAEQAQSNEDLVRRLVEACRGTSICSASAG